MHFSLVHGALLALSFSKAFALPEHHNNTTQTPDNHPHGQRGGTDQSFGHNHGGKQTCLDGVYIVVARGTHHPQHGGPEWGMGKQHEIAEKVKAQIPHSKHVGLVYPAEKNKTFQYSRSESTGVSHLSQIVTEYSKRCPGNRVVLMGESQGAQVVADTLCGSANKQKNTKYYNPPIADSAGDSIAAVLLFGDPSHKVGMGWNVKNKLTATTNGQVHRDNTKACSRYYNVTRSYCDAGDAFCQTGRTINSVHGSYPKKYSQEAVNFIVQKAKAYKSAGGNE